MQAERTEASQFIDDRDDWGDKRGTVPRLRTELVLNMGPQHPSTHGVLRVILKLDGEKVLRHRVRDRLPASRRGEDRREPHVRHVQSPYVDRMDYVAAVSNGLAIALILVFFFFFVFVFFFFF